MMIGLDIEGFRRRHGLTYRRLASMFGVPSVSQMRRYAIGAEMLRDERLERVLRESRGEIDLYAIHQRGLRWLREHGGVGPAITVSSLNPGEAGKERSVP